MYGRSAQVIPWLSFYGIATIASLLVLLLKAKMFRDQVMRRRAEFELAEEEQTDRIVKLKKHQRRSMQSQCVVRAECV